MCTCQYALWSQHLGQMVLTVTSAMPLQWLFFVRLFADLAGRLLPRAKRLALPNQVPGLNQDH